MIIRVKSHHIGVLCAESASVAIISITSTRLILNILAKYVSRSRMVTEVASL